MAEMASKVNVFPSKGSYKGGTDVLLVFPCTVPDSSSYYVTFRKELDGRATSAKVEGFKVDDKTVMVRTPSFEKRGDVRLSVFGDHPLQLPTAEFEFVGAGRLVVHDLPMPVTPQQILGVMLLLPDKEIRCDSMTFEIELTASMSASTDVFKTLRLHEFMGGTRLSSRDDKTTLLHICAEYGFLRLANFILNNSALYPSAATDLGTADSSGMKPADVAVDNDELEIQELFIAHGALAGNVRHTPHTKKPNLFKNLTNRITRTGSVSGEDERTTRTLYEMNPIGNSGSMGRSGSIPSAMSTVTEDNPAASKEEEGASSEVGIDGSISSPAAKKKDKGGKKGMFRRKKDTKSENYKGIDDLTFTTAGTPTTEKSPLLSPVNDLPPVQLDMLMQQVLAWGRVKMAYEPSAFDDTRLKLAVNDVVFITEKKDNGVWTGILNKKKYGHFPMVYVTEISRAEAERLLSNDPDLNSVNELDRVLSRPPALPPGAPNHGSPLPGRRNIQTLPLPPAEPKFGGPLAAPTNPLSPAEAMGQAMRRSLQPQVQTPPVKQKGGVFIQPTDTDDSGEDSDIYCKVTSDDEREQPLHITTSDIEEADDSSDEGHHKPGNRSKAVSNRTSVSSNQQQLSHNSSGSTSGSRGNSGTGSFGGPSRNRKQSYPGSGGHDLPPGQHVQSTSPKHAYLPQMPNTTPVLPVPGKKWPNGGQPAQVPQAAAKPPPPATPPPPGQAIEIQEDEETKGWYTVSCQADILSDFTPDNTVEQMDYMKVQSDDVVNVLCEVPDESWALVEKAGKVGRVVSGNYAIREDHMPYVHNLAVNLQKKLSHIDYIEPGDQLGICVDKISQELVIFEVGKDEDTLPPPLELPPPPEDEETGLVYEDMQGPSEHAVQQQPRSQPPAVALPPKPHKVQPPPPARTASSGFQAPPNGLPSRPTQHAGGESAFKASPSATRAQQMGAMFGGAKPPTPTGSPSPGGRHGPPPPVKQFKKPPAGTFGGGSGGGGGGGDGGGSMISDLKAALGGGGSPLLAQRTPGLSPATKPKGGANSSPRPGPGFGRGVPGGYR